MHTIDRCNPLIMEGEKTVFAESSRSINLTKVKDQIKLEECTVFELDNFTRYLIFKNPNDQGFYTKNIYFGWMMCKIN